MSAFTAAVERGLEGLEHVSTGPWPLDAHERCDDCEGLHDDDGSPLDEGHFSWSPCDACGSSLGGNRYAAHGIMPERKDHPQGVLHLDVCADCLVYLANGDEPDSWE